MPFGLLSISKDVYDGNAFGLKCIVDAFIEKAIPESIEKTPMPHEYDFYMDHPDFIDVVKPKDAHYLLEVVREYDGNDYAARLTALSLWYDGKIMRVMRYN